jgi:hypothetical protein
VLRSRISRVLLCLAALGVAVSIGAGYGLSHWLYVPSEPLAISRQFIDLVQAGDLAKAYLLTAQEGFVGATLTEFDARIRQELGIASFPTHRAVEMIRITSGPQTYGNRLRRWLLGRKLDHDQVSLDYFIEIPFEVRLAPDQGTWRIVYFQSHAM